MGSRKSVEIDLFPSNLEFAVFSSDEIKKLSVVKVITGMTYDPLGHPLPGGLYDTRMGTYGERLMEPCATCLSLQACPGHMGHIELNALVYNSFFLKVLHKILAISCFECFQIQIKNHVRNVLTLQLQLIDAGFITEAQELENFKSEVIAQKMEGFIKQENGSCVHPRIAQLKELLGKQEQQRANSRNKNNTKTSCAIRAAVLHVALQRPSIKKCIHCSMPLRNVRCWRRKLSYFVTASELKAKLSGNSQTSGHNKIIFADECRKLLRQIYAIEENVMLLQLLFPMLRTEATNTCPMDLFFMDTIPVTPSKVRPSSILRDRITDHAQTSIYRRIIEENTTLCIVLQHMKGQTIDATASSVYEGIRGDTSYEKLHTAWQTLQDSVDTLVDAQNYERVTYCGLKQVLEKKDGLIRKHMMGKRVDYSARTVITPDPNINVEEVGIPDIFARKLSYPVPVTPWNVADLRKMVINGPLVHPGANYIQDERGYTTLIPADNRGKRESMANLLFNFTESGPKIVHRHVLNGDVLLMNRQPSLHRPSIMAHKARILHGEKTFRLHYSNCKAYNADFDGDEMNAHYPQNEVARAEAYNIVSVANNYLVPKDGTPLGGLIQDHVISGVKLSMRGRFFNREDYQQLVFQGLSHLRGNIKILPPSILKPVMLWSGKQILSTLIKNIIPEEYPLINLKSNAKIAANRWVVHKPRLPMCGAKLTEYNMSEHEVVILKGELLTGVLDKQQYGATTFGLIHCVYELYGGEVSTNLLTAFTKVFTYFLQREGFTLGVKDILVTSDAENNRRQIIKECREIGNAAVSAALELDDVPALDVLAEKLEEGYIKDPTFRVLIDRKYKAVLDGYTNAINKSCLPTGLITKFPDNNLELMVLSGAKGSMVNSMQISCLLGQIELEGKRPPLMISGKSLPSFTSFETSPKSGGFIDGRFLTGIQPQDFFFHCMAGREGLIDTAVKTSRSGYLQRCLIKHLEGLTVNYDLTVRDSDNSVVQYLYGEDGLDILKSKFLHDTFGVQFLEHNTSIVLRPEEMKQLKDSSALAKITRHTKKIRSWLKKNLDTSTEHSTKRHLSAFVHFSAELRNEVDVDNPMEVNPKSGRRRIDESIIKLWMKADLESKTLYRKKYMRCPDPTASVYKQDCNYGTVSELIEQIIQKYRDDHSSRSDTFADIMFIKNMKSLAAPGEPVGLLAAQSVGEPSTQMTLNTFHFAGRGEMNVTLGIPRLREILMLASSNIKTPSLDIPILPNKEKQAEKLRIHLNRVTLADVLQNVNIKIKLVLAPHRAYQHTMRFQFLPRSAYKDEYCVRPKNILKYMNDKFFKILFRTILRSRKKKDSPIDIGDNKTTKLDENNADDDIDMNGDDASGHTRMGKTATSTEEIGNSGESSGEEIADDDDDAAGIKLKTRKLDETEYDDPEDVEEMSGDDENDDEPVAEVTENAEPGSEDESNAKMVQQVVSNDMVNEYIYDKEEHLWCQLTFNLDLRHKADMSSLIRELAKKAVVHEVPNIKRAIIYKNAKNDQLLKTDGINIVEMFNHDRVLSLNGLYCNDIHAIARVYGIEAATQAIIREVTNVFNVYGITISRRHLSLIADYMTFDGTFQPLSRKGMEHSSSPLQQMSFESCMQFLTLATGYGKMDDLSSPTSRLMVGLPIRHGTGAFDLLTKIR